MPEDSKIEAIVSYLRAEFAPVNIYLFGSRAKGTAHSKSDYDFVVISELDDLDKWQAFDRARREIWERFNVQADVWVYSQATFNELLQDFGSIPETALNTGVEV